MAVTFVNADNDRIQIPNESDYDLTGEMTILAWVKSSGLTGPMWDAILTKGDGAWRIHRNSTATPERLNMANSGCSPLSATNGNVDIVDGSWHLCIGIIDSLTRRVIVDDDVVNQVLTDGSTSATGSAVWIGSNSQHSDRSWEGQIALAAIYDRAISVNEALAHHSQRGPLSAYGRRSFWPMLERAPGVVVSGSVIKDIGARQNDGSPNGTPEWAEQNMVTRRRRAA